MLPSLNAARARVAPSRVLLAGASLLLAAGAAGASLSGDAAAPAPRLADALAPATWAMRLPAAWLATTIPGLQAGDVLDLYAIQGGARATAVPVAYAVAVLAADDAGAVLELGEEDAIALASAHAAGAQILALLRSTR